MESTINIVDHGSSSSAGGGNPHVKPVFGSKNKRTNNNNIDSVCVNQNAEFIKEGSKSRKGRKTKMLTNVKIHPRTATDIYRLF